MKERSIIMQYAKSKSVPAGARYAVGASLLILLAFGGGSRAFALNTVTRSSHRFSAYRVDITTGSTPVVLKGGSTSVVTVTTVLPKGVVVHFSETGGILHVMTALDGSKTGAGSTKSGRISLSMPRYEFVSVHSASAPVSIDNLSTNHLSIATKSGTIDVSDTNAALKVTSDSGAQSYHQIYGAIDATSTNGAISVDHATGVLDLHTKSGSLVGKGIWLTSDSDFQSTSGSISIGLNNSLYSFSFSLHSHGGKLQIGQIVRHGALRWGRGNINIVGRSGTGSQDYQ